VLNKVTKHLGKKKTQINANEREWDNVFLYRVNNTTASWYEIIYTAVTKKAQIFIHKFKHINLNKKSGTQSFKYICVALRSFAFIRIFFFFAPAHQHTGASTLYGQ